MEYLVYENCDENTKIFIGILLILSICILMCFIGYFWFIDLKNKLKNKKDVSSSNRSGPNTKKNKIL